MPKVLLISGQRCFLIALLYADQQLPRCKEDPVLSMRRTPYFSGGLRFSFCTPSDGLLGGSKPKEVFNLKELREEIAKLPALVCSLSLESIALAENKQFCIKDDSGEPRKYYLGRRSYLLYLCKCVSLLECLMSLFDFHTGKICCNCNIK